jgi:hypothetical protein
METCYSNYVYQFDKLHLPFNMGNHLNGNKTDAHRGSTDRVEHKELPFNMGNHLNGNTHLYPPTKTK